MPPTRKRWQTPAGVWTIWSGRSLPVLPPGAAEVRVRSEFRIEFTWFTRTGTGSGCFRRPEEGAIKDSERREIARRKLIGEFFALMAERDPQELDRLRSQAWRR
jgi:hypothetical protein